MNTAPKHGFTLIELLITVAVVAILATIAYPSYQSSVVKGRRADGKTLLMHVSGLQERWFTENMTYTDSMSALGLSDPETSDSGYYTVTILSTAAAAAILGASCPIKTCFVLEATPLSAQVSDGKMALASTGIRYHDANNNGSYGDSGENQWP
ncbi:MAG: type IV pilin protein [Magnetococcales bacterium]|nr:type IV pilin protein [Magnetococcales bacterium]MBF0349250.1 type IV pilin protein [Magnetococcales bacterium]